MSARKTLTLGPYTVEVTEVPISKRTREEPNEYELEDGAIIRVVNPTVVVYRTEGPTDPEGNPMYLVKLGTQTVVVRGPRKPDGQGNGSSSETTGNIG